MNEVVKVWYLISILKLSGPNGNRAHFKAIKIIMEKFRRRSQRSSRLPRTYYSQTEARYKAKLPFDDNQEKSLL